VRGQYLQTISRPRNRGYRVFLKIKSAIVFIVCSAQNLLFDFIAKFLLQLCKFCVDQTKTHHKSTWISFSTIVQWRMENAPRMENSHSKENPKYNQPRRLNKCKEHKYPKYNQPRRLKTGLIKEKFRPRSCLILDIYSTPMPQVEVLQRGQYLQTISRPGG